MALLGNLALYSFGWGISPAEISLWNGVAPFPAPLLRHPLPRAGKLRDLTLSVQYSVGPGGTWEVLKSGAPSGLLIPIPAGPFSGVLTAPGPVPVAALDFVSFRYVA